METTNHSQFVAYTTTPSNANVYKRPNSKLKDVYLLSLCTLNYFFLALKMTTIARGHEVTRVWDSLALHSGEWAASLTYAARRYREISVERCCMDHKPCTRVSPAQPVCGPRHLVLLRATAAAVVRSLSWRCPTWPTDVILWHHSHWLAANIRRH